MPGDSIELRILSVVPRIPYGTTGRRPGRSLRPLDADRPANKVTVFDLQRNVGLFEPGVEVPLGPFMGVMGLLPPLPKARIVAADRRAHSPATWIARSSSRARRSTCRCSTRAGSSSRVMRTPPRVMARSRHGHRDGEHRGVPIHPAQGQDAEVAARGNAHALHHVRPRHRSRRRHAARRRRHGRLHARAERLGHVPHHAAREHGVDFRITQIVDGTKGIHAMIPKACS